MGSLKRQYVTPTGSAQTAQQIIVNDHPGVRAGHLARSPFATAAIDSEVFSADTAYGALVLRMVSTRRTK